MIRNFQKGELFFKTAFKDVGSSLGVKNVDISENLFEQYSGVNFIFNDFSNYIFCFEFQKANYKKMMYGIKRINQCCKNDCSTLESYIRLNFQSYFRQKNEASKTSSFLVCAPWLFYKNIFCKEKSASNDFEKEMCNLIKNLEVFFHMNEQTPWGFWKNDLNKKLLMEYKTLSLKNVSDATKKSLSCPMFIHLGLGYKIHEGVFFVGRETLGPKSKSGWGTPESRFGSRYYGFENYKDKPGDLYSRESIMMETQSQWLFDKMHSKSKSHFFNALKDISGTWNGADFYYQSKFVWDELIAMDYKGKSLDNLPNQKEKDKVIEYSKKKLTMELNLLKPKYAIFFTGFTNFYRGALERILDKKIDAMVDCNENKKIKVFDWNEIKCFLTEHPRNWNKDEKKEIAGVLKKLIQK